MSAQPTPSTAPAAVAAAPLSSRAAVTILGSMLLLIVALTVVLVQTTWASPEASIDSPTAPASHVESTDLARH